MERGPSTGGVDCSEITYLATTSFRDSFGTSATSSEINFAFISRRFVVVKTSQPYQTLRQRQSLTTCRAHVEDKFLGLSRLVEVNWSNE